MEGETNDQEQLLGDQQPAGQAEAGEEDTPLTVDELKKIVQEQSEQITKLTAEDGRKEGEIQRLHGITRSLQKQGTSPELIGKIAQRIEDLEMGNARLLDALEKQGGLGDDQPTKKTHVQLLEERRAEARQSQETPQADPDQIKFIQYMWSQGLNAEDQIVKDATANGTLDPVTALKNLKDKVKASSDAEMQRRITEGIQEGLKGKGATKGGAKDPSASNAAWRGQSAEGKIRLAVSQ